MEDPSRAALRHVRRVCIKAGTSVVTQKNGLPSLTRMSAMVEQISELVNSGVDVILVSSGAVGMGKRLLRKQTKISMSIKESFTEATIVAVSEADAVVGEDVDLMDRWVSRRGQKLAREQSFGPRTLEEKKKHYDSACAAAGQYEMMNLYQSLFSQYDVAASQLLVTQMDFTDPARLKCLRYAIERLLESGILPIINENDASGNRGYAENKVFNDNDSLAALCARNFGVEALLLLTDVEGVYDRPPSDPKAKVLRLFQAETTQVEIGSKSAQGRGGMAAKIDAALSAVRSGSSCTACVVASGANLDCIREVFGTIPVAEPPGTLFCTPGSALERQAILDVGSSNTNSIEDARTKAVAARAEARKLQGMPYSIRQDILRSVANSLWSRRDDILAANELDVQAARTENNISIELQSRLLLTEETLEVLAASIRQIADRPDPLGVVKTKRELADGLVLSQITVPVGVIMIVLESRPDAMPQMFALAFSSGNGILWKGSKEAVRSNGTIHNVLVDAIITASEGKLSGDIIGLLTSRGQVANMQGLDDVIDLVIPRGSNDLVAHLKGNTNIPVLGHTDGVCHVYVDATARAEVASKIVVDAKTDNPAASNAMETLLLHELTLYNGVASAVLMALRAAGVKCLGGPRAMKSGLCENPSWSMKHEYGDLTCMVEVVSNVDEAVEWIHSHGSGHTESIVCDKDAVDVGETFLKQVDAACVFKNASTCFADGVRFGLGTEVGISTGRIHARGPVGVEGLLTTKWQLRSSNDEDVVGDFVGDSPRKHFTHQDL